MPVIIGLVIGASLAVLVVWLRSRKIAVKWYEWLIGILGLLLLIWAVHDFFASMAEYNEIAAWTLIWLIGVPSIVLIVTACLLVRYRHIKRQRQV